MLPNRVARNWTYIVYDSSKKYISISYVSVISFGVPPEANWVAKYAAAN